MSFPIRDTRNRENVPKLDYKISHSRLCCCFVGNISYEVSEADMIRMFERCGAVMQFKILQDKDAKQHKGYGFCEFKDEESALNAVKTLNGIEINARTLRVDHADIDLENMDNLGTQRKRDFIELQSLMPAVREDSVQAEIFNTVNGMSTAEVFSILEHFKVFIKNSPLQAKALLIKNPNLGHALMQCHFLEDMVADQQDPMPRSERKQKFVLNKRAELLRKPKEEEERRKKEMDDARNRGGVSGIQKGLCFDFQRNACTRGANCPFKHILEGGVTRRIMGVCFDFQEKGTCMKGRMCKFDHVQQDGTLYILIIRTVPN